MSQSRLRENRNPISEVDRKGTYQRAIREAFVKLDPRIAVRNPVMFVVWLSTIVTFLITLNPNQFGTVQADPTQQRILKATPEDKIAVIREEQSHGRLVALTGHRTNDAPALAQANIGLAMNAGTQAAKDAANMIDLDSDPTKLIDLITIAKQLLITRGALTTFSIANDIAKYFAIIPTIFAAAGIGALNIMGLKSAQSAIISALIYNTLIIPALIAFALSGVQFRPLSAG